MQGVEERRLRRISNTLQGEAIEGNSPEANKRSSLDPALRGDDTLMVDQGYQEQLTNSAQSCKKTSLTGIVFCIDFAFDRPSGESQSPE